MGDGVFRPDTPVRILWFDGKVAVEENVLIYVVGILVPGDISCVDYRDQILLRIDTRRQHDSLHERNRRRKLEAALGRT